MVLPMLKKKTVVKRAGDQAGIVLSLGAPLTLNESCPTHEEISTDLRRTSVARKNNVPEIIYRQVIVGRRRFLGHMLVYSVRKICWHGGRDSCCRSTRVFDDGTRERREVLKYTFMRALVGDKSGTVRSLRSIWVEYTKKN